MPRERKGSVKNKNNNSGNDVNDNEMTTKTTNKKRRTSNANNSNNNNQNNNNNSNNNNNLNNNNANNGKGLELIPPQPISTFGDTIIASNPFDDTPQPPQQSSQSVSQQSTPQSLQTTPQSTTQSPNNMIVTNASMASHGPQGQAMQPTGGPQSQPKPVTLMSGKIYPSEQSMVFNPANPNAPPIYPCGVCHKEVHDNDQAILCESGCNFWFHRICTGLTERAYCLLHNEIYAEWVCNTCTINKTIPLIKFKP